MKNMLVGNIQNWYANRKKELSRAEDEILVHLCKGPKQLAYKEYLMSIIYIEIY